MSSIRIYSARIAENHPETTVGTRNKDQSLRESEYSENSLKITVFLRTFRRLVGMSDSEFKGFRKEALKYFTRGGHLFRRPNSSRPTRRVVNNDVLR